MCGAYSRVFFRLLSRPNFLSCLVTIMSPVCPIMVGHGLLDQKNEVDSINVSKKEATAATNIVSGIATIACSGSSENTDQKEVIPWQRKISKNEDQARLGRGIPQGECECTG